MPSTPLPIITGGYRVAHHYHSLDATFVNVYWVQSLNGSPNEVGPAFIEAYDNITPNPTMRSLHTTDITLDHVVVTPLDGVSLDMVTERGVGIKGLGTPPMAAANAAMVITWGTGQRGRNKRGRTYLAGMPNASLDPGGASWSVALETDAQLWVGQFVLALATSPIAANLMVVSQHSVQGPSHSVVSSWTPRRKIGSQRRRTERAAV